MSSCIPIWRMAVNFCNKHIVIVGSSKGIGRAIALELAHKGANLTLIARQEPALKALIYEINNINPFLKPKFFIADVSLWSEVEVLFNKIKKSGKKIDGLINNVGFAQPGYFHEIQMSEFERSVQVNYMSALYCCYASYPNLQKGGFITFTSSVAGFMGVFGYSSYAGPKFALLGLAETLVQELEHQDIHISVLFPPDTNTPGFERENITKPYETKKLSKGAKVMSPENVAKRFIKNLSKGKFIITCNLESKLFFRLHGLFPSLVKIIMTLMIRSYRKNKK